MSDHLTSDRGDARRVPSRRAVLGAAAFTVPAIALVVATPAHAMSDPGSVTLTVSRTLVQSGEQVDITVVRTDALGQPLAGQAVTLSGSQDPTGQWELPYGVGYTDSNGVYRAQGVPSGVPDATVTLTATVAGSGGTVSASRAVTLTHAVLSVSVSPTTVATGGAATVTVRLTDNAGRGMYGFSVSVSASDGASLSQTRGYTNALGRWTTRITAPAASGSSTITAQCPYRTQYLVSTATLTVS
ncbi:Ig-like domain-containing protein [Microbacterium sp. BH-3-3-3]|uniref:Ig-like domain-containing protein n=1 Tax=Microbacterium sp. BH-3-3-3 TaxID=1906742 RepID=UPI0011AA9295|nr:hypothetical protein [Microbacterium sp. BH-3-3-3]